MAIQFWTMGERLLGITNWGEGVNVIVAHVSPCGRGAVLSEAWEGEGAAPFPPRRHWLAWREPDDDAGVWGMMDPDDHDTDYGAFSSLADAVAALPHYTPTEG